MTGVAWIDMNCLTSIHDVPAKWARATPEAIALIEGDRSVTYGEMQRAIADAGAALSGLGVGRGHRVLLVAENCATLVYFVFAASELGAAFVLVNARLSAEEIDAIALHAQAQAEIYIDAGYKDAAVHALRREAAQQDCCAAGLVKALGGSHLQPADTGDGVAALIYTSGTTGKPKGVMLTHSGLLFVARTLSSFRRMSSNDRSYGVLPMSHTMGLTSVLLGTLVAGGSVVLRARFDVEALVVAIEQDAITMFQGVQAMHASLLNHLKALDRPLRDSSLRYVYAGGSPLDPTLKAEVETLFDLPLHNGYGMTESSPTICHSRLGERRDDASVGPPLPGVSIRIVDESGADLPPGASGELWVNGPNVMRGYFRDAKATDAAIQHGWLRTGDLATQDANGNVFLVGRIKDIIIRSGFNVYPAEVEAAINRHPAVEQSIVVGREVSRNEEVVAFVQRRQDSALSADELQDFLRYHVSAYKRPSQIVFVDEMPTMTNGKVARAALKALAASPL